VLDIGWGDGSSAKMTTQKHGSLCEVRCRLPRCPTATPGLLTADRSIARDFRTYAGWRPKKSNLKMNKMHTFTSLPQVYHKSFTSLSQVFHARLDEHVFLTRELGLMMSSQMHMEQRQSFLAEALDILRDPATFSLLGEIEADASWFVDSVGTFVICPSDFGSRQSLPASLRVLAEDHKGDAATWKRPGQGGYRSLWFPRIPQNFPRLQRFSVLCPRNESFDEASCLEQNGCRSAA